MEPTQKGFKHINGIELYFEIYGEGRPLVLVHGGGGSICFDFARIIERLSPDFMLIGVDLQNHGRSGHRNVPETFEQDAKDVTAMLDALGIEKAAFLGFSNGGNTVMQIAHLFPERVERMVVASSFFRRDGMPEGFFEGMMLATIDYMPSALKENFLRLNPDEEKLANMFEKDSQRMIHFSDWDESLLKSIKAPTLFIAGDKDVVKPGHAMKMQELVEGARLAILPAGHGNYLMNDENGQPDNDLITSATLLIRRFLSEND